MLKSLNFVPSTDQIVFAYLIFSSHLFISKNVPTHSFPLLHQFFGIHIEWFKILKIRKMFKIVVIKFMLFLNFSNFVE